MPPRWLALSFVAFWVAMTALFFWRDVLPSLNPTEPLMFPVELIDEAGRNQNLYYVGWNVSKNGSEVYVANVEWNYLPENDSFESHCKLWKSVAPQTPLHVAAVQAVTSLANPSLASELTGILALNRFQEALALADSQAEKPRRVGPPEWPQVNDVEMESHYFMTRKGQMLSFRSTSQYNFVATRPTELKILTKVTVEGVPGDRQVMPRITMSLAAEKGGQPLPPLEDVGTGVEVGERNIVLNPLHPVRRFPSLQAGQHWRVTMIDPLAAFGALPRALAKDLLPNVKVEMAPSAFVLEARVQPDEETFLWEDKKEEIPCRIIRIGDDRTLQFGDDALGLSMRLWVAVRDGLVMRQEVSLMGDHWVMVRRSQPQRQPSAKINPRMP